MSLGFLFRYGLFLQPIVLAIIERSEHFRAADWGGKIALSFLPTLLVAYDAVTHEEQQSYNRQKRRAMHPEITKALRFKEKDASGLVIGRHKGKLICRALTDQGSVIIIGSTGTGKSSTLIMDSLLLQKKYFLDGKTAPIHYLVADPKGEMYQSTKCPDDDSWLFSPSDRNAYGFDPLAGLSDVSTEQEIQVRMRVIAISMVPDGKTEQIWSKAAKNMMTGLLVYFFRFPRKDASGNIPPKTLPNLLLMITAKSIAETVQEALETCEPDSIIHTLLGDYHGMGNDTLTSIDFNLKDVVKNFVTDSDIVYALSDNPKRFCPEDLLNHNVFVNIPLDKLEQYGSLFFIITNVCLSWMMGLPEHKEDPERPYVGFIMDETVALLDGTKSKPTVLLQALRVIRSKGAMVVCAGQSISGLECVMSKAEVGDFLSNFTYRIFLDCTDSSQDTVTKWVGRFRHRKVGWNGTGGGRKSNTSYEDKDIVTGSDLSTLSGTDELLLVSPRCVSDRPEIPNPGFAMVKKAPFYKDRYFKAIWKQIKQLKEGQNDQNK